MENHGKSTTSRELLDPFVYKVLRKPPMELRNPRGK